MAKTTKTEEKKLPALPWTVKQAAEIWGIHHSRVRQLCEQKRIAHRKIGGGEERAQAILIDQTERPERLPPLALKKRAGGEK